MSKKRTIIYLTILVFLIIIFLNNYNNIRYSYSNDKKLVNNIYEDSNKIVNSINSKNIENDFRNIIDNKNWEFLINLLDEKIIKELKEINVVSKFKLLKVSKKCFIYKANFKNFLSELKYETYNVIKASNTMWKEIYNWPNYVCTSYKNCFLFLTEKWILDDTEEKAKYNCE